MKNTITTLFFAFTCTLFCPAQTELQFKYKIEDNSLLRDFLVTNPQWQNYGIEYHSVYVYSDIYLDTPDKLLYKNGYSLRFRRKKMLNDSITSYVMQLKSEMQGDSTGRLEVEEENLRIYSVCLADSTVSLVKHLDRFFAANDSSWMNFPDSNSLFIIKSWLKSKSGGIILPILEIEKRLKVIYPDFDAGDLEIAFSGMEHRYRLHFYAVNDTGKSNIIYESHRIRDDALPVFFTSNTTYSYLAEISFDNAVFWRNWKNFESEDVSIPIKELEIENKYHDNEKGIKAIVWLENELKARYKLEVERNSKYRQCVEH